MKKLIMAVAAVFAVVGMASAVNLGWGGRIRALDANGDPLEGGTAYLVYLGENGTVDATFSNGAWSLGDDVIVQSAHIYGPTEVSYSSSVGFYMGNYNTGTKGAGSKYVIIVTDKGADGTTLPTEGYYGITAPYTQQLSGANDNEQFNAANATAQTGTDFSSVTANTPTQDVPEPTTYALIGIAAAALALRKRFLKK